MRTCPMCPTMPSEMLTSYWTTSGIDSVALSARPTPKALIRDLLDVQLPMAGQCQTTH